MNDLFVNVLGSIVFYVLGLATKWGVTRFKIRGQRRFWAPFLGGRGAISVVLTDKNGQTPRSPRKISITDVLAYSDIRSALASLGKEVEIKVRSEANISELSRDCFISLGGPLANGISDHVLKRLGTRLPVSFNTTQKCFEFAGAQFCTTYDQNQLVERDYGLVVRLQKLASSDTNSRPALVAFGLHGHGTQQIVAAIVNDKDFGSQLESHLSGDCYGLMEFTFSNHKVSTKRIVSVGKIN